MNGAHNARGQPTQEGRALLENVLAAETRATSALTALRPKINLKSDAHQPHSGDSNVALQPRRSTYSRERHEVNLYQCPPPTSPDDLVSALRNVCELALTKKYPRKIRKGKRWWNKEIEELRQRFLATKRSLTRANKRTKGCPPPHVLESCNNAFTAFKEARRSAKEETHKRLCEKLNDNPWGDAYRVAMQDLRPRDKPFMPKNPQTIIDGLFPPHPRFCPLATSSDGLEAFTNDEIIQAAKKLKGGKCGGPDGIPVDVVKMAALDFPTSVASAMNEVIASGLFPVSWKAANLRLIPKQGHSDLTPKLRPICLIDASAKLLEHLLNQRLQALAEPKLSPNQHAFRRNRSTNTAIEYVLRYAEKAKARGTQHRSAIILLDVVNAFNSANWNKILMRLREIGASDYLVRIFQSYFTDRAVLLGGQRYQISSGVPQGSVTAPTLWNLLINPIADIPLPYGCELVLYADDIAILVTATDHRTLKHRGNLALRRIHQGLSNLGLELAPHKSTAMIFNHRPDEPEIQFALNGHIIFPVPHIKYLGVTIDAEIKFNIHATRVAKETTSAVKALANILGAKNVRMARRRIICRVVEAKLLYGCEVWAKRMLKGSFGKLEAVQKRAAVEITRGLFSTSGEAALLLAGMVPLELQAAANHTGFTTGRRPSKEDNMKCWQERWDALGPAWTRLVIPRVSVWINRPHGELSSALTELLSGQGHFGTFLKKSGRRPDSNCPLCRTPETLRHVLLNCPRFDAERIAAQLQNSVNPRAMTTLMLKSPGHWRAIEVLARRIRNEGVGSKTKQKKQ